jgi:CsoR family transcriptional regulator, copper-sensing transcriptional repressor
MKDDICKRLNRIEGQIKGIKKMVDDDKYCCSDILTQVAAVRAAINKVGVIILENHSKSCIKEIYDTEDREKAIEELMITIQRFVRFID